MKKIAFSIIAIGAIVLVPFFVSGAENCRTEVMFCDNDHSYTVFICDDYDKIIWDELLCGLTPED